MPGLIVAQTLKAACNPWTDLNLQVFGCLCGEGSPKLPAYPDAKKSHSRNARLFFASGQSNYLWLVLIPGWQRGQSFMGKATRRWQSPQYSPLRIADFVIFARPFPSKGKRSG